MNTRNIIVVFILIVMVVGGLFLYLEKVHAPTAITTQSATTTNSIPIDWKTYTVADVGITFQAPKDFISQASNGGFELLIPIGTSSPYFHTHLIQEAYIKASAPSVQCLSPQGMILASSTVEVDDSTFIRQSWNEVGAGNIYQGILYTFVRNGLCYQADLYTHSTVSEGTYTSNQDQITMVDTQQKEDIATISKLFDQIIQTVTFIK